MKPATAKRLVKNAKQVSVVIPGFHDVTYLKITKEQAYKLINSECGLEIRSFKGMVILDRALTPADCISITR